MTSWNILKKFLKEEEIVTYSNGCNTLLSKPQIKKKEWKNEKRDENKEEAPVASTSKPHVNQLPQEGKKNKEKNWKKSNSPSYKILRIQKYATEPVFNMAINSMEFKDKEEKIMRQPSFPKKYLCIPSF
ncbi:hypothetical protein O181_050347 [Austropuccinia psidii MF-1]|uniref:Uncharacterized protein n=1 Tax=Austropuccinia psidii MF-1 TaxID=1389203 RepID=A0A9Q3E3G9_9BASI|nr:hypothetical protein [Austropuccinia psidii MF-1]